MKTCTKCGQEKPRSQYTVDRQKRDGLRPSCKDCAKQYWESRGRDRQNPTARREATRRHRYRTTMGITPNQVDAIRAGQDYKCYICQTPESELSRQLHIDHCHKTKTVRRALCVNCNLGIGNFRDNPQLLSAAAEYLKEYSH